MRKAVLIGILGMFVLALQAETQTGYVRTIGRNGKPGKPISGVMVRAEGPANMVMSDTNGQFALLLNNLRRDDAFKLTTVKKSNYELLDKDLIGRECGFTPVPMEIVLVNLSEMQAEKAAMAERFEQKYAETYQKKVAELQAQLDAQQITIDEAQKRQEELDQALEKMLGQIETLVDRYVRTDFDRLDSIDQQINAHIEMGEFDEAERLIRSKGSVEERLAALQERQEVQRQLEEAARQVAKANDKDIQSLKRDLNLLIDIADAHLRPDSAYYYRKQLTEVNPEDVENLKLLMWAAFEFEERDKIFEYFDQAEASFLSQSRIDTLALAKLYGDIGTIITFKLDSERRYKNDTIIFGMDYYKKKLDLLCSYYGSNSIPCAKMLQDIALTTTLRRSTYTYEELLAKRNSYYEQAREIYQNILETDNDNIEALAELCEVQKWLTGDKEEYRQCVLSLLQKMQKNNTPHSTVIKQIIGDNTQVLWAFSQEEMLEMIYHIYSKHLTTYEDSLHIAGMILIMTEHLTTSLADSCQQYAIGLMEQDAPRPFEYKRLNLLGKLYYSVAKYEMALVCYERIHNHDIMVYGNCSHKTITIKNKLSDIYNQLGNHDRSQELRQELLECH